MVEKSTFPSISWPECRDITSFTNGTGGLEVYFVHEIQDALGLCESSGRGILVDANNGSLNVMSHEIGHACGLDDIYIDKGGFSIAQTNLAMMSWETQDWNNGPGNLYYQPDTPQTWIISKMLMYGIDYGTSYSTVDIPLGEVYGVKWNYGTTYIKDWVKVGLDNSGYPMKRNPVSN